MEEVANMIFTQNGVTEEDAMQITNQMFTYLDENNDGVLSREEFCDQYVNMIKRLRLRQLEIEDQMLEDYEQYKFVKKKADNPESQASNINFRKGPSCSF